MGRPKVALIAREAVVAKALAIIDRDGVEGLNIRKLAAELGVTGGALYHHFRDKEEILQGVRVLVLGQVQAIPPRSKTATWREYLTQSGTRYRSALLNHPNAAPLYTPTRVLPGATAAYAHVIARMTDEGVPLHHCYAMIDSVEGLAFASAQMNPRRLRTCDRLLVDAADTSAPLIDALRTAPSTADELFRVQLDALLDGWETVIERSGTALRDARAIVG